MAFSDVERKVWDRVRSIPGKVEDTFHTEEARKIGAECLEYMHRFLDRIEEELSEKA
jgi:ATP phosphoribosyltransferase regulatory subunit HisZ